MKTISTKKILLICLALIFAAVTGLFATLCYRNAYAAENPDGIVAYADGDEEGGTSDGSETGDGDTDGEGEGDGDENGGDTDDGDGEENKGPGEGNIAPPTGFDDEEAFDISFKELTVQVETLKLLVTGWNPMPANYSSVANIVADPEAGYSGDIINKIDALVNSQLISYSYWNVNGEQLNTPDEIGALPEGSTYFKRIDINEKYAASVELRYAENAERDLSILIGYRGDPTLEKVQPFDETKFTIAYLGVPVDIKKEVLNGLMSLYGREDYLIIVESESDAFVQNRVGEYRYKIVFKTTAKYCWDNGNTNDRSAVEIIVNITPLYLSTDGIDFGEIPYTGLKIDITEKIEELFKGYVEGFKTSVTVVNSGTTGENAGEYEVKLVIKGEYSASIKWEGDVEFVIAKWYISKTTIHGEWETFGKYGIMNIVSDIYKGGDSKAIKYTYYDITNGEPGDIVTKLEVGHKYKAVVELLDENNLEFDETTELTYIFDFTEEPVTLLKPVLDVTEQDFTGEPLKFTIKIGDYDITDERFADKIEIVWDESEQLTQTEAGEYTVVIRLKEGVFWTTEEGGFFTGDERLTFTVKAIALDYKYDSNTGLVQYISNYKGVDYISVVRCVYTDEFGRVVTMDQMEAGKTYIGTLTLIDTRNFFWKEGVSTTFRFTLKATFNTIDVPDFNRVIFDFTGSPIDNFPESLKAIIESKQAEILAGNFVQTNAGTYSIIVKANTGFVWKGDETENVFVEGDIVKFVFRIRKANLNFISWNSDGTAKFTSNSFTGVYKEYVQYVYEDEDGNLFYQVKDLKDGKKYTVTVSLTALGEANFNTADLPVTGVIQYKAPSNGGSSFPWWIFLILGLLFLIIIIVIIIIIVRRRNRDDDYDDFYGDEYYGDDDVAGGGYGDDGGYDDYGGDYGDGGYADYGADY